MGLCSGRCFSAEDVNFTSISDGQDDNIMDCDLNSEQPSRTSIFGVLKLKTKRHSRFLNRFWRHHHRNQQQSMNVSSYVRLNASRTNSALTIENQNYDKSQLPYDAIQLQCLDVGSLLKYNERRDYERLQCDSLTEETPSFAGSSLDLQWEHEYDEHERFPTYSWHNSQDDLSSSDSDENGCSIELTQLTSSNLRLNRENNNYQPMIKSRQAKRRVQNNPSRCSSASQLNGTNKVKSNNSWSHISTPDSLEWDVHEDEQKFRSEEDSLDQETVDLLNEIERLKNRALFETGDTLRSESNETTIKFQNRI